MGGKSAVCKDNGDNGNKDDANEVDSLENEVQLEEIMSCIRERVVTMLEEGELSDDLDAVSRCH